MARQQLADSVYWSLVTNCLGNKKKKNLSCHSYAATILQYEVDIVSSLLGFPEICSQERVQKKDIQKVKPHGACNALKCDLQASLQPLMGKLCTLHKLSQVSKISLQRSFYSHIFEAAFPFCFFSKSVKMSIKGYNYVVSLIAYLKQNLQGFNARFEKGGGRWKLGYYWIQF